MSEIIAFLDTNIFLHFQPIEQIDWQEVLGDDPITLAVAPIVVRELDKHKDQHRLSGIRDRARTALKKVRSAVLNDPVFDIPEGVNLIAVGEPDVDFRSTGLERDISDDHLVASCLAFEAANPNVQVILIAHDTGPMIKAVQRGIEAKELPERYKLPSAVDDVEKELKQLRRRVMQLEHQLPKLDLSFSDGNKYYKVSLMPPLVMEEEEIIQRLTLLKEKYPDRYPHSSNNVLNENAISSILAQIAELTQPRPEEFKRYNEELKTFYQGYENYLRNFAENENIQRRTVRLDIILSNTGTAPAEDIDIFMHFPDGFTLFDEHDQPLVPEEPTPPHPPRTMADMIDGMSQLTGLSHIPAHTPYSPSNISGLDIRKSNSYNVEFSVRRLKQYLDVPSDPIFLVFDSYDTVSSFGIEYRINSANLPEEVTGKLHVVIEK